MPDDPRDIRTRKHVPTAGLLLALKHGSKPPAEPAVRATTETGVPSQDMPDMPSRPVTRELGIAGLAKDVADIAERQREERAERRADTLALGAAIGDIRLSQVEGNVSLATMARLAEKDDIRKDAADQRAADLKKTTLQLNADVSKQRGANRLQIVLAVIAAAGAAYGTYALGRSSATPPAAQIQVSAPAAAPVLR